MGMEAAHSKQRYQGTDILLQDEQFEAIRDILARYSGVYLDRANQRALASGVATRLRERGMSLAPYMAHISQPAGGDEIHQLSELVLNHETIFFRNQPHMHALREVLLPQLHRRKPAGEPLRIWSAGCSTGEEPYSLAITVLETLGRRLPRPVDIWATDLSDAALAKAREGTYRGRTLSNVSPELCDRYFEPRSGQGHGHSSWAVTSEVRSLVHFEQFNLLDPFPPRARNLDIIFCQNVTIYFELPTFRSLVDRFYHTLKEGGLLFLGFSETLWNIYDAFRLLEIGGAFVYVKDPPHPQPAQSPPPAAEPRPAGTGRSRRRPPPQPSSRPVAPPSRGALSYREPQTAHSLSPGAGTTVLQEGRALLDVGRVDEVLEKLNRVPLNGPHAPQTLALIARAHANRGDLDLAVAEARRAIELDALTTEAYILLGVLYVRQGQVSTAARYLERARYLDPDAALISFHLADAYRQLNRSNAALREYRNTLRKLAGYAPDTLLDGVAVGWLRETCERYLTILARKSP